jgi:radical SAM superfamily enzyme YgiQ (UPF0313 family)
MNITLVFPPFIKSIRTTVPQFVDEHEGCFPPLGIMYIASYLKKYGSGDNIQLIDAALEKLDHADIAHKAAAFGSDIVGISCWTFSLIDTLLVASEVKKLSPKTVVVLGGPHINIYPEETLGKEQVDFAVTNDGEKPFCELVAQLKGKRDFGNVPNLFYKQGGKILKSECEHIEENLDRLPFPERGLTDINKYYSLMDTVNPVTTMITSRGCPFNCHFCLKQNTGWRHRSMANIMLEMRECVDRGIRNFFIFDETFTVNKKRILELCNEIIKEKLNIVWSCRARVDTVDEEIIRTMKKAGCMRISFGVESGNPEVLKMLNKQIAIAQVEKVFALVKKERMVSLADFMVACPKEGPKESAETIQLALRLDPDYAQFTLFTLLPETKLYETGLETGVVKGDVWLEYARNPTQDFKPPIWNLYTEENAVKLLNNAYRAFYLRPKFVFRRLLSIRSASQALNYVTAGLGMLKGILFKGSGK